MMSALLKTLRRPRRRARCIRRGHTWYRHGSAGECVDVYLQCGKRAVVL